ncbi:MAG TPA: sigma-54 dependent transcriptional regulator [Candidatus Binataceae bacterium]|jgi:DNA-binding NtrC family response regulator|nr:sigma-54 dependent transcriptional regulator [Candidatus Binataceae bacterium]
MTIDLIHDSEAPAAAEWIDAETLIRDPQTPGLIGDSAGLRAVSAAIARVAPHKGTVLILGESGTGKELVAEALHRLGPSPKGPLVRFNCSNLVNGVAESQLFGHVRGAFTDAREAHLGCFRQAIGGTLLLDEVGELPLTMQSKILRAVENLEVQPVGSSETFSLDLRLLVATNRDLRAMIAANEFRADLYYRLDVASLRIPPLRERLDDTSALAAHFIKYYNRLFGKRVRHISRHALTMLSAYQWPGNVRELAHTIERATLLCENDRIDACDLPPELVEEASAKLVPMASASSSGGSLGSHEAGNQAPADVTLDGVTKTAVSNSLAAAHGDCAKAARYLGISRPSIYRKMARYGLRRSGFRNGAALPPPRAPRFS